VAEIIYNEATGEWEKRQMLRSPYIDYSNGRFFVTFQAFHNKSVFGAIVGDKCVLNELGEAVKAAWQAESDHVAGLTLGEFVVMPNHFHAIVEYYEPTATPRSGGVATRSGATATGSDRATAPCGDRATAPGRLSYSRDPHARDLPYVIGLFKSYTTTLYHQLKAAGKCVDIGAKLWQESFYDELIKSDEQYRNTAHYILRNPGNWHSDRFGAVTSFAEGNLALLQSDYVAYLSSEGYVEGGGNKAPMRRYKSAGRSGPAATPRSGGVATGGDRPTAPCGDRATAPGRLPPVISTFTSYYERQVLAKCLASERRFIWVCPGGFTEAILAETAQARAEGRALLISPVERDTGVNKQRANWCNQFIAKNAADIWIGHIRPGGSLEAILKATLGRADRATTPRTGGVTTGSDRATAPGR